MGQDTTLPDKKSGQEDKRHVKTDTWIQRAILCKARLPLSHRLCALTSSRGASIRARLLYSFLFGMPSSLVGGLRSTGCMSRDISRANGGAGPSSCSSKVVMSCTTCYATNISYRNPYNHPAFSLSSVRYTGTQTKPPSYPTPLAISRRASCPALHWGNGSMCSRHRRAMPEL